MRYYDWLVGEIKALKSGKITTANALEVLSNLLIKEHNTMRKAELNKVAHEQLGSHYHNKDVFESKFKDLKEINGKAYNKVYEAIVKEMEYWQGLVNIISKLDITPNHQYVDFELKQNIDFSNISAFDMLHDLATSDEYAKEEKDVFWYYFTYIKNINSLKTEISKRNEAVKTLYKDLDYYKNVFKLAGVNLNDLEYHLNKESKIAILEEEISILEEELKDYTVTEKDIEKAKNDIPVGAF